MTTSLEEIINTLRCAHLRAEDCAHDDDATRLSYVEAYGRLSQQVEFALGDLDALRDEMIANGSDYP